MIQVEAYVDPADPHQLPSTFPCNLCTHLHQAVKPTQVLRPYLFLIGVDGLRNCIKQPSPFPPWLLLYFDVSQFLPHYTRCHRLRNIGPKMLPAKNISPTIAIGFEKINCNCITLNCKERMFVNVMNLQFRDRQEWFPGRRWTASRLRKRGKKLVVDLQQIVN